MSGPWGSCQRCGYRRPLSTIKTQWNGLRVCPDCYERRNAQEMVRAVREQPLRGARPPSTPVFLLLDVLLLENGDPILMETDDPLDLQRSMFGLEVQP